MDIHKFVAASDQCPFICNPVPCVTASLLRTTQLIHVGVCIGVVDLKYVDLVYTVFKLGLRADVCAPLLSLL